MNKQEFIILFEKNLSGAATPEEIEQLDKYKDDFDINDFSNSIKISEQAKIKKRIFKRISSKINQRSSRIVFKQYWWLYAAASILLFCGLSFLFQDRYFKYSENKPKQFSSNQNLIMPGSNNATLILSDGREVNLATALVGKIIDDHGLSIHKVNDGQLKYEVSQNTKLASVVYNKIIIPKGGQYSVSLPDGTDVWLNSASSLEYPTSFSGNERRVELSGEGYFEVKKNSHKPFFVHSGDFTVKVLGTHFNIAAYQDEFVKKITLLEGSVLVQNEKESTVISPGQQALTRNDTGYITTRAVNVEDAVDWKNGYFSFRKENIQSAMRKIARWYDIEVVYQGRISQKLLGGTVQRTQKIEEILSYFETIGIAKFKIEGRRVFVKTD
ncbi:MAG: FecR family protein [Flavobacterium sp.]|nr:MAG: FecR family protein [Flavobacterium sp.]